MKKPKKMSKEMAEAVDRRFAEIVESFESRYETMIRNIDINVKAKFGEGLTYEEKKDIRIKMIEREIKRVSQLMYN